MSSLLGPVREKKVDFARHEIIRKNKITALNPLDIFPTKSDSLSRAFFSVDVPEHIKQKEDKVLWLDSEKIDPEFGIKGDSQDVFLRRSYRRIGASQAFVPLKRDGVSLQDLYKTIPASSKKFVLVEQGRLAELTKFENILREEQDKLGEQCAWLLSDVQASARIPIPAVRLAMHNLCEEEMKKAAMDATELLSHWKIYSKKKGYNKSFLFSGDSYLNSCPVSQRAAKMKMMKKALQDWLTSKFQDTMSFEDDLSHAHERYLTSQVRRRDYDRYFVLATRYGEMDESEFYLDSNPGGRYFNRATLAARRIQRKWDCYWPIKRMRMHRAARLFQTLYRGYRAYKVWHPIIRLRIHVGKRAAFKFCFKLWLDYNRICRMIKESLTYVLATYVERCFSNWKGYVRHEVDRRKDILNRFIRRMKNGSLAGVYLRWVKFTNRCKHVKLTARRILQNPHFLFWVHYTKQSKYIKYLGKNAVKIQALARGYVYRMRYLKYVNNGIVLSYFGRLCLAKLEKLRRRKAIILKEYKEWKPFDVLNKEKKLNDKERRRLILQTQYVQERENQAVLDIRRHFRKADGKFQINEVAREIRLQNPALSMKEARFEAQKKLLEICSSLSRSLSMHDYCTKNTPCHVCADPGCKAIFISDEQYINHIRNSLFHNPPPKAPLSDRDQPVQELSPSSRRENALNVRGSLSEVGSQSGARVAPSSQDVGSPKSSVENVAGDLNDNETSVSVRSHFDRSLSSLNSTKKVSRQSLISKGKSIVLPPSLPIYSSAPYQHYASFHISMKNQYHFEKRRDFILRTEGIGETANCFEFWSAVKDWRKIGVTTESYIKQAVTIYEMFLRPNCNRPIRLACPGLEELLHKMERVKNREFEGVYQINQSKPGWLRRLFHIDGHNYEAWTSDNTIEPTIFDMIEWYAFLYLYSYFENSKEFSESSECKEITKHNDDNKGIVEAADIEIYSDVRRVEYSHWAKSYVLHEARIVKKSYEVIDREVLPAELDLCIMQLMLMEANLKLFDIRYVEQIPHEQIQAIANDAAFWSEEDILESVYDNYVNSVISAMWDSPDTRKELLEFAGYLRKKPQSRLLINMNARGESKAWFDKFINNKLEEEEAKKPLTREAAILVLQRRARGMVGRNKVRKIFTKVFVKR